MTVSEQRGPRDSDEALADVLGGDEDPGELVTLEALADRTGLSLPLLQAVAREGLLIAQTEDPPRYRVADAEAVRAGLELVEAGLPLGELLDLARRTDEAMRPIAEHAVDLFVRFVRDPVLGTSDSDEEASGRLVAAFQSMLPATEQLVGLHFRELLLAAARELWEREAGGP
jgi:hypothetical protein